MFLTVQEVKKNRDGVCVPRVTSITAERVLSYREYFKGDEHKDIEGVLTKVKMARDDGFEYFIIIAEECSHFENRVNKVLWLNSHNTNASSAEILANAYSSPELPAPSSGSSAENGECGNSTSQ